MTYKFALGTFVSTFALVIGWFVLNSSAPSKAAPSPQAETSANQTSQTASDQDIALLRQDIRSKKKQLIAANLTLTDAEATRFWPMYDQYAADLSKIDDSKYAAIKEYAQNWGSVTDERATSLAKQVLDVDVSVAQLRQKYLSTFQTVLPGKKLATFFQLDRRLNTLIDVELASQIPLVQSQP